MTFVGGLPSVLFSNTAKRANIHINDLKIDGDTEDQYNVKYHGAIGDGVADDTLPVQAAVEYAKLNGGSVYFPVGTYMVLFVNVSTPTQSFGMHGDGPSSIIKKLSGAGSVIQGGTNSFGFRMSDLTINGNETFLVEAAGHGITLFDMNNITIQRVRVEDYFSSGILIYRFTGVPGDFKNNWVLNCEVNGSDVANNGILLVDMHESGMIGCIVRDLDPAGSPSSCLQLKNKCNNCIINSCTANGGISGIALGSDEGPTELGVQDSAISNCSVANCKSGIFIGGAVGNVFSNITIDMEEAVGSLDPIRMVVGSSLALSSRDNVIKGIRVKGVLSARNVVHLEDWCNNNFIEVDHIDDPLHLNIAIFAANTAFNRVRVNSMGDSTATDAAALISSDAGSNNELIFQGITSRFNTLRSYTVATLPAAGATNNAAFVIVSDETGGFTAAYSDGTNWRRVQDRMVVA